MSIIHLDFETRSEVDIWKVGAWNYSTHPSTEILCMAWGDFDRAINLYNKEFISKFKFNENLFPVHKNCIYHAHYSMFENYIWHNILVKRYGWPKIPLRQWRCTAALAATYALPRALANTAIALDLKQRKDMSGKSVMLKMCKPRTPTKNNPAKWFEDPEDFEKLYKYCINDVEVERAIDNTLPALSKKEQKVWFLDQRINTRGIYVDIELVDAALSLIEKFTEECNVKLELLTNGYLDKASQVARFKNWMATQGVHMESINKEALAEALKYNKHPKILQALKLRKQIGKTSVKKFQAIKNAVCSDGRIRDMFVYHGASTGRWTGKIVQVHNLPRGTIKDTEECIKVIKWNDLEKLKFLYPDVMSALSSCVRGALIATPGKDLLVADFASIEARVLAWVAGETETLNEFKTGEDSYVKMAQAIYQSKNINSSQRFVGKTAVLGCGYGMGWKVFQATCASMGQEVSEVLARKAVDAFRKKNSKIVYFWNYMEQKAIEATKEAPAGFGKIRWVKLKDFLYCILPSGRRLAYHHPKIERKEKFGEMRNQLTFMGVAAGSTYIRQSTWGGTLVENIVQAIARDILVEAMLRVEKAGYPVILHVHDEIVVEIPEQTGLQNPLEHFISLIEELPVWAKGCPIKAEGWRGKRYRK